MDTEGSLCSSGMAVLKGSRASVEIKTASLCLKDKKEEEGLPLVCEKANTLSLKNTTPEQLLILGNRKLPETKTNH